MTLDELEKLHLYIESFSNWREHSRLEELLDAIPKLIAVAKAAKDLDLYINRSLNDALCVLDEEAAERLDKALKALEAT